MGGYDPGTDQGEFLVGVPGADGTGGPGSGRVDVFEFDRLGNPGSLQGHPQFTVSGSSFGAALDCDGSWLAIGAPGSDNEAPSGTGLVYVYRRLSPGTFGVARLVGPPAGADYTSFGREVAIFGDTMLVSCSLLGGLTKASVHEYRYGYDGDGGYGWLFRGALFSGTDLVVSDIAIDGGKAAISAWSIQHSPPTSTTLLYERVEQNWRLARPLRSVDSIARVDLRGAHWVVGSPTDTSCGSPPTLCHGAAYVNRLESNWVGAPERQFDDPLTWEDGAAPGAFDAARIERGGSTAVVRSGLVACVREALVGGAGQVVRVDAGGCFSADGLEVRDGAAVSLTGGELVATTSLRPGASLSGRGEVFGVTDVEGTILANAGG